MADQPDPQQTSEKLAEVLKELALKIERLKQLYEQYFMGIERMEPMVARKECTRTILLLQQGYIRNTALRYRFNTMLQKWGSYTTYWSRTLREIENGTYVRHIQKAARAAAEKGRVLPAEMRLKGALHSEAPASEEMRPTQGKPQPILTPPGMPVKPGAPLQTPPARTGVPALPQGAKPSGPPPVPGRASPPPIPGAARPPVPPEAARPPVPSSGVPGMSENDLRALHRKYSEARVAAGDNAPVRYESLVATLQKQAPKLLEQPGVRGVRFDVSVRDGKAVLKAIPTK